MKYQLVFLLSLFIIKVHSQIPNKLSNDTTTILKYDTTALRIPGNTLPIGIIETTGKGVTQTKGLLKGKYGWRKYKLEVVGGSYSNGKIKILGTKDYKKGDSITINIYTRKWFLGGKDKFLLTKKIPYDYETGIKILTKGTFSKAPGNHVAFGIRTFYDNYTSIDKWAPTSENLQDFILTPNGSHISKSKGDLKIDNDPIKITNDKVILVASLAKAPAIKDTMQIIMDYIYNYKLNITSSNTGHKLKATVNVYYDSLIKANLMKVQVKDSNTSKIYNYLFNFEGGSLSISSRGANGAAGWGGSNGMSGSNGSDGSYSTETETVTNADGTTSTNSTTVQGPGDNGQNGEDGGDGGNGQDGYNGGNITISYDTAAQPFLKLLITATSIPGSGGAGGSGGYGGSGGSGGSGSPSGSSGSSGRNGSSGSPGADGKPGKIVYTEVH